MTKQLISLPQLDSTYVTKEQRSFTDEAITELHKQRILKALDSTVEKYIYKARLQAKEQMKELGHSNRLLNKFTVENILILAGIESEQVPDVNYNYMWAQVEDFFSNEI